MNLHQDDSASALCQMTHDPRFVDDLGRLLEVLVNERLSTSSGRVARFGDLLRRHRRAADLTQEELAERANISQRTVSDLERGTTEINRGSGTVMRLTSGVRAQQYASSRKRVLRAAAKSARPSSDEPRPVRTAPV
jgi:transcriptional regulator GlxA family with amidase domain